MAPLTPARAIQFYYGPVYVLPALPLAVLCQTRLH